ncbi:MAG: hypothetical protein AAF512_24465 [Pseudomonadota bacterium]
MNENIGHMQEVRAWAAHPKGYFQPGVLVLTKEGRVLYRWRSRPTRKNAGGAIMRPTPEYAWAQIQSRLNSSNAESIGDAALDATPQFDARPAPWPLFMLFLLAHGWFLKPEVFPEGREGEKHTRPEQMWPRLGLFLAVIVLAFALLPATWVTLGLVAWGAFIWPGVARYHRAFQNVPEGEPRES